MRKIILTLPDDKIVTGKQVSFVAPCGSLDAECITISGADFIVCNAMGVDVSGTNAWASGAMVSVILNVEDHRAYIQNADVTDAVFNAVVERLATWDGGSY